MIRPPLRVALVGLALVLASGCKDREASGDVHPVPSPLASATPEPAQPSAPPEPTCPDELAAFLRGSPTYLHVSDVHLDLQDAGVDTGPGLWTVTQRKLAQVLACPEPPRFVLYTGDLPGHFDCLPDSCEVSDHDKRLHTDDIRVVLADLATLVESSGTPLLYMPGNNDSLAGDYFSFTDADGDTPLSTVAPLGYPAVNVDAPCDEAHPAPCIVDPGDPHQGYYSARPIEGLRVLALNTVVLGHTYEAVDGVAQPAAAKAQLAWFEAQLDALGPDERALVAMHIPPGVDSYATCCEDRDECSAKPHTMWAEREWQDRFLKAIEAHAEQVVGLAYGHTHYDELRRVHAGTGADGEVVEIAVSAPGVTFNHDNNPAFKLVAYDGSSKELTDFLTLHTDKDATEWGDAAMRMREVYACADEAATMLDCLRPRDTDAVAADVAKTYLTGAADPGCSTAPDTIAVGVPVFRAQ